MTTITIGCNFDFKLIEEIQKLNQNSKEVKIIEFYGSDRIHHLYSARPKFRLPKINKKQFIEYIRECNQAQIGFNYTLNNLYWGSKREIEKRKKDIKSYIIFLEDSGVKQITISTPIVAEIIREVSNSIKICISTIAHIDSVTQIKVWHDNYKIYKVYGNILKNRSILFLKNAATLCNTNDITLSLLVNEFCGNGAPKDYINVQYASHCIFRDSCFLCHSENTTKEDDMLFNNYPMNYCISSRNNISSWLKTRFIRPEDMKKYHEIGIDSFKITGRTGTTEYILAMAKAYLEQRWEGNLLGLWKPLETIHNNQVEMDFKHTIYIDNTKLDGFINHWFSNSEHECSNEICGITCNYCNNFADKIIE